MQDDMDVAPLNELYVPAGQFIQTLVFVESLLILYVPAGHRFNVCST
jgi:hypothetical protein